MDPRRRPEAREVAPKAPVTERGRRTRARLVAAAREVFEDSGFLEARITEIAVRAGVAYGTFYTYFATKADIFREVANVLRDELLGPAPEYDGLSDELSPARWIEESNRRYLAAYARNARIMAVFEQVATFDEELLEMREQTRVAFVERSARAIARWQQEGVADAELDPRYAACALGSMVDRFAYVWLVLGGDFGLEKSVGTLTRLWVQAVRLEDAPPAGTRAARPGSSRARTRS